MDLSRSLSFALVTGLVFSALPASAQPPMLPSTGMSQNLLPGRENDLRQCSDGVDNDGNGYVDCQDSKCWGIGTCSAPPRAASVDEEQRLSPRALMVAGGLMMALGVGIAGSSAAVLLDAQDNTDRSKRIVGDAVGGIMAVAGAGFAIGGAVLLKRGLVRLREDREMGLAFSPTGIRFIF